jgi:hypothetical protein
MIALPPFVVLQHAGIGRRDVLHPGAAEPLNQQPVQARLTNVIGDVTLR